MVGAKPVPTSGDPFPSIPSNGVSFGSGGGINNPQPQYQNPSNGFNSRPTYIGSTGPFLPSFPVSPNAMGYYNQPPLVPQQQQQQQFVSQLHYPYLTSYNGNNVGDSQIPPYYGPYRPIQGGQGSGSVGGYPNQPLIPLSPRFQTNLQFGQQPQLRQPGQLASTNANHPSLFDRMDTDGKSSDEQIKKSSQM